MSKEKTSICFTGDIGFDKYMDNMWKDEALLDRDVEEFLLNSDHLLINLEGALSNGNKNVLPNSVVGLMHSMNPEVATFLQRINADIWNICNNHIMDAGSDGLRDTLKIADKLQVKTIGAGMNLDEASKPLILDEAGGIGIFAVGYQRGCKRATEDMPGCLSWNDMERIEGIVKEIKKKCRWCIIVAHGGEEFTSLPAPYTRDRYIAYLKMGADVVVSHHPHVPMNYETFDDGKMIFYSLGNFIFDTDYQRAQYNTEKGIFVRLDITKDKITFEPFGIRINRENEHIEGDLLPKIFEDVREDEYKLLIPLSCKAFLEATKKQQRYLFPDKYKNATEEDWHNNFYEEKRSGRVPGEGLDLQIICPIADKAKEEEWKKSSQKNVLEYILEQIES